LPAGAAGITDLVCAEEPEKMLPVAR